MFSLVPIYYGTTKILNIFGIMIKQEKNLFEKEKRSPFNEKIDFV
jgi:hypothetical protein